MAKKVIDARVRQKVGTEAEWLANDLKLLDGEAAIVRTGDGTPVNLKFGDGNKKFSELPYFINFNNAQRISSVSPGALPTPTGENVYMVVTGVGTWTYGGVDIGSNADGYQTTFWWNGSAWSNNGSVRVKGDPIPAVDNLSSTSAVDALSANMGRWINLKFSSFLSDKEVIYTAQELSAIKRIKSLKIYVNDLQDEDLFKINSLRVIGGDGNLWITRNGVSYLNLLFEPSEKLIVHKGVIEFSVDLSLSDLDFYNASSNITISPDSIVDRADYINKLTYEMTNITRDTYGNVTDADVVWEDNAIGLFKTTNYNSTFLTYDSYWVNYVASGGGIVPKTHRLTQPVVTRNNMGAIIEKPKTVITTL